MTTAAAMRVLIVEDEVDLGAVFQDYVVSRGHEADVVGSAEAALQRISRQRPHAIVLDVKLPGMSGLEFMSLPAVKRAGIPVIVISGHATEQQARECLRLGALEFLAKPVPLEILGTVLEHVELLAASTDAPPRERRLSRRVPADLPVRLVSETGTVATGRAVEVSATGLRARLDTSLKTGTTVRVSITMPGAGVELEVIGLVVRTDPGGAAVWFLDLAPTEAERLLALAQ
jgi:CheY-like chemotaxis protein